MSKSKIEKLKKQSTKIRRALSQEIGGSSMDYVDELVKNEREQERLLNKNN